MLFVVGKLTEARRLAHRDRLGDRVRIVVVNPHRIAGNSQRSLRDDHVAAIHGHLLAVVGFRRARLDDDGFVAIRRKRLRVTRGDARGDADSGDDDRKLDLAWRTHRRASLSERPVGWSS